MGFSKGSKYLVGALVFALLNMGAIFLIFGFQQYGDTPEYVQIIHWFRGEDTGQLPWRIIRPLGPLMAAPFEFLGEGAGLVLQNIIFYFLCAFLMFKITELVWRDKRLAFFASLFFVTATPVIEVGLSYLTDTGGWFFFLLSIFLTLLYFQNKKGKLIPANGFLSGLGVLLKESGGLGVSFFGLMLLLSRNFKIKEKISKMIYFGIFFLVPVAVAQFFIFKYFHLSSLDLFHTSIGYGQPGEGFFIASLRYLGQLFRILGILWPLVLIGIWLELKEKNWERIKIFLALLPSSLTFLFWSSSAGARTVFFFAPLGIILAVRGLGFLEGKLGNRGRILLLVLFIFVLLASNYYFSWLNPKIPFFDLFINRL